MLGEAAVYVLGMSSCWAEAGGCLCPRYVVLLCWGEAAVYVLGMSFCWVKLVAML